MRLARLWVKADFGGRGGSAPERFFCARMIRGDGDREALEKRDTLYKIARQREKIVVLMSQALTS
jgi:hypothetical protein